MFYKTNDGPPAKPASQPSVGTPPQTHYFTQSPPPMPPAMRPPQPPQYQQQNPNLPPGAVPVLGGGYQYSHPQQQPYPAYGYPVMHQQVVVQKQQPGTNHGLHIILSILTAGMWVPIWLIIWAVRGR